MQRSDPLIESTSSVLRCAAIHVQPWIFKEELNHSCTAPCCGSKQGGAAMFVSAVYVHSWIIQEYLDHSIVAGDCS